MTRKRDRHPSPPSDGLRQPPRAGARTKRQAAKPAPPPRARLASLTRASGGSRRCRASMDFMRSPRPCGAAARTDPPLRDARRGRAPGAEIAARGVETQIMTAEEISARAPREAVHQGRAARGAAAGADRHFRAAGERPGARSRPDHRSAQCRRDPSNRGRLRGRRARHHRAPFARIRRRAGQIRLGRSRACADLQRHQSRARARRNGRHGLLADRARFRRRPSGSPTKHSHAPWRWSSAPRAGACDA